MDDELVAIRGATLRRARRRAGLTQVEMAAKTGLDQAYISKVERGGIKSVAPDRLAVLAAAVGADRTELLDSSVMYREGSSGAIMPAPVDPAGRLVPTVFYYAPDGAVVGRSGLDARERAAVDRLLARIDAWRAGRGEEDAGGGEPGAGDPR